MLTKRIIPCLDVRDKKVTKGVKFKNNIVLGDPVELAAKYYEDGCDELVFYDITASAEARPIDIDMVGEVAKTVRIPFSVGGGISTLDDMSRVLLAGAEKVSVNSLAVKDPRIIAEGAKAFGSQCIVLGMDAKRVTGSSPSRWEVFTHTGADGGRATGLDAVEWAQKAVMLGAGEIVVNSIDADGTRAGYDTELTCAVSEAVSVPVIASGGAGTLEDLYQVLVLGKADAVLAASIFHYGIYSIRETKEYLAKQGIPIRI